MLMLLLSLRLWRPWSALIGCTCLSALALVGCSGAEPSFPLHAAKEGFKITFPAAYETKMRPGADDASYVASDKDGGVFSVTVGRANVPDNGPSEVIDNHFGEWKAAAMKRLESENGRMVHEKRSTIQDKYAALDMELELGKRDAVQKTRIVLARGRAYVLMVIAKKGWDKWQRADAFFSSFEVLP
jgi:hypothetical protein